LALLKFSGEFVQLLESLVPNAPVAIEPYVKLLQGWPVQSVKPLLGSGFDCNKPGLLENFEVLRHLGLA
jgi:hypothetical protein